MYSLEEATKTILECKTNHKASYGQVGDLPFGAGLLCDDVVYPMLNPDQEGQFMTVSGLVLILTHECDLDNDNGKILNDDVLICPIIPFELVFELFKSELPEDKVKSLINALANDTVQRMMYLPPVQTDCLEYGGVLFFNKICSTDRKLIDEEVSKKASLSAFAYRDLGYMLSGHLLRPKSASLPLTASVSPREH